MLEYLQFKNSKLNIKSIHDSSFSRYGKILDQSSFSDIFNYLDEETKIPEIENAYIAHDLNLQAKIKDSKAISNVFGNLPVEYGYVNGNNSKLNALEYHKSSEINVALTSLVLILGRVEDIKNNIYDIEHVEIYYVPSRTVIELFPQTLHFSPCKTSEVGFKCGVILPYGTNMEFIHVDKIIHDEDQLLFKTNKWILIHKEHEKFSKLGAHIGLNGTNIEIKY